MAKGATANGVRTAPHPMLLALVAQFLENNGFNSSHRIYNTERRKRPKKEGWEGTFAKNYTAKFPPLETIFQTWQNSHIQADNETSESDGDDSTDSSENSQALQGANALSNRKNQKSGSASDDTSGSDSSSEEDEEEEVETTVPVGRSNAVPSTTGRQNGFKRKAPDSSSDSESEEDKSSSSEDESESETGRPMKKQRTGHLSSSVSSDSDSDSDRSTHSSSGSDSKASSTPQVSKSATATRLPSSSEESSSDPSSDSDSSAEADILARVTDSGKADSESSGTVIGDTGATRSSPDSNSSASPSEAVNKVVQITVTKKQHIGAHPTRLAQISAAAESSDYVSNDYVSYEYADKAYRDLSITRGKGFTKEKNKKKRGSYRGGAIDISGGKAFKFDD